MTQSTTLNDMLKLAQFESELLTALAYKKLGINEPDEDAHIDSEIAMFSFEYGMGM